MAFHRAQIRSILSREGISGMYAGYGAFMMRDLPFDAIEFVAYEQVKRLAEKTLGRDINPGECSVIGAFAGGFTGETAGRGGVGMREGGVEGRWVEGG
jgi:hypothetical protein